MQIESPYFEGLAQDDWTMNPSVFNYSINFRPNDYNVGCLAESWEFSDPSTYVVHLRQGIHWQNIPPVNGREFTSDDVVFHYDRMLGFGDGYTKPAPYWSGVANWKNCTSVTAIDKYTVAFKWNVTCPEFIEEIVQALGTQGWFEAPEAVQQWGNLDDWHHAIGTGPFILSDYVSGSSVTFVKNPNYWGYDERYPKNRLPYINTFKLLIIADSSTALTAVRTGKIEAMDGISAKDAQQISKTNPELLQLTIPAGSTPCIDPRNDVAPFNDIRVREAMQMAIDLPTIASTYYGGTADPNPSSLTSRYMTGWGFPYDQWPQDLKDQYSYNLPAAKKLLSDAGYPNGFKTDIVADLAGDMNLLQIVKSDFAAIDIDMDIRTMDPVSWVSYVQVNKKNDQLDQRGTAGSLGFTYEPMRQLQRFMTNNAVNYPRVSDPVYDAFYTSAMAATNINDIKTIVKEANLYVAQQHFTISLCQTNTFAFYQPWLKGYDGQSNAISGTGGGPNCAGFYMGRFWIEPSLKK